MKGEGGEGEEGGGGQFAANPRSETGPPVIIIPGSIFMRCLMLARGLSLCYTHTLGPQPHNGECVVGTTIIMGGGGGNCSS